MFMDSADLPKDLFIAHAWGAIMSFAFVFVVWDLFHI